MHTKSLNASLYATVIHNHHAVLSHQEKITSYNFIIRTGRRGHPVSSSQITAENQGLIYALLREVRRISVFAW